MNRKIAIVPLFFASLMLLVHLAVPHHHHHGTIICLLNYSNEIVAESHCFDTHHHDHADGSTGHEGEESDRHSHNETEQDCFMDDLYRVSETKQSLDILPVSMTGAAIPFLFATVIDSFEPYQHKGLPFREKPFIISYLSLLNSGASGLRGPPIV